MLRNSVLSANGSARRRLIACACCAPLAAAAGSRAMASGRRTALTADQALVLLKQGNANFVADNEHVPPRGRARRLEIAESQTPFAVLVTCSDSRVPPELLFGRGLGELFTVRNAGNTIDTSALGSIEYAVSQLGVPLVVVMGHARCGAVQAAISVVERNAVFAGSIGRMVEPIIPAVLRARQDPGDLLDNAVRWNVLRMVDRLNGDFEPMLQEPLKTGALRVVGATYDLDTGAVAFLNPL